jgi:hypothetical protein
MTLDAGKEQIRRAFPVGGAVKKGKDTESSFSKEETPVEQPLINPEITLSEKKKIHMATLTLRYPVTLEARLEKIARCANLNKTEVVLDIFNQTFPGLEKKYNTDKLK